MLKASAIALAVLVSPVSWAGAQTRPDIKQSIAGKMNTLSSEDAESLERIIDFETASIQNDQAGKVLVTKTIGTAYPGFPVDEDSFYCIIHVLRWNNASPKQVGKQNWYVYHRQADNASLTGRRILGSKNVWLLIVHSNSTSEYELQYDLVLKPKVPANVADLLAVGQLFPGAKGPVPVSGPETRWLAAKLDVRDLPSGIEIDPKISADVALTSADGAAVNSDPPIKKITSLDKLQTFTNEGKYLWDVGLGVPVQSIKQLKKNDSGEVIAAEKQDRSSVLALFNLYPKPVDLSATVPPSLPHFSVGFDVTERPTRRVMIGGGFGLPFLDFYVGRMRVAQPAGDGNGGDLVKWQWTIGLMVPARRLAEVLK